MAAIFLYWKQLEEMCSSFTKPIFSNMEATANFHDFTVHIFHTWLVIIPKFKSNKVWHITLQYLYFLLKPAWKTCTNILVGGIPINI